MAKKFEPIPNSDGQQFQEAINSRFAEVYTELQEQQARIDTLTRENAKLRQEVERGFSAPRPAPIAR